MAKFSKEWCDIWDPERVPDFSIEDTVKDVLPDPPTILGLLNFVNSKRK